MRGGGRGGWYLSTYANVCMLMNTTPKCMNTYMNTNMVEVFINIHVCMKRAVAIVIV